MDFFFKALLKFLFIIYSLSAFSASTFKSELLSPLNEDNQKVLIWGTMITLTAVIFEEHIDQTHDEVVDHKPIGEFSPIGDLSGQLVPNILYIASQTIAGYYGNSKGYARAIGMLKATTYAAGVTTVLKYTIREPRPDNHDERNSFPSGHTTTAFAFSGYVLAEHGYEWGVPALFLSSLTALSRINDNRHRTHDVFAGATIGLVYGLAISRLSNSKSGNISDYQFAPILEGDIKGLAVTKSF